MTTSISSLALPASSSAIPSAFAIYDSSFHKIIGPAPKLELILENNDWPFAHEAGVFNPSTNELFMTSNLFKDPATGESTIRISKVQVDAHPVTSEVINTTIPMANGGTNHADGILFCGQGTLTETGGLFQMSAEPPYAAENLIGNLYGREFNSINDVAVHNDGSIWFTDPIYGYIQGIRPKPVLPSQVYRFDPTSNNVRVVADGFGRPNGIQFSPDERIVYISDTAETYGNGTTDPTLPATIYAFDVSPAGFLTNRRVFAMADTGIPDGIHLDTNGNVYAGCGDGINVWSAGGVLLGKILIKTGSSNFGFGRRGELFILNENKLWRAQLSPSVKGAILKI